jgi:cation:H+ antiporter
VTLLLFALGLVLLVAGAEMLVRGAGRIAVAAGITPLVVGLTVVAFGTSAPELAVTVAAAARGTADLAVGNVVGSNIMNILLILGISSVVTPLLVRRRVTHFDVPVLIGVSMVVILLALNGRVTRLEGVLLMAAGIGYTAFLIRTSRVSEPRGPASRWRVRGRRRRMALNVGMTLLGLGMLVLGSHWLVEAATTIATLLGISELAIGLTVVAIGTSLPELATSVVAGLRGQRDMAVGNIIGSNLMNLLVVLGAAAAVSPAGLAVTRAALEFDLPIMLLVTAACFPIFYTGRGIGRWEGGAFLAWFVAYTSYVLLVASGQEDLHLLRYALLFFALPFSVVTVALCVMRVRMRRESRAPTGAAGRDR